VEHLSVLPPLMAHMGWGTMRLHAKSAQIGTAPEQLSGFFLRYAVHRR
jgi:hypothetical protein